MYNGYRSVSKEQETPPIGNSINDESQHLLESGESSAIRELRDFSVDEQKTRIPRELLPRNHHDGSTVSSSGTSPLQYGTISVHGVLSKYNPAVAEWLRMENSLRWATIVIVPSATFILLMGLASLYFRSFMYYICTSIWCGATVVLFQLVVARMRKKLNGLSWPIAATCISQTFCVGYLVFSSYAFDHDLTSLQDCTERFECHGKTYGSNLMCVMVAGTGILLTIIIFVCLVLQTSILCNKRSINLKRGNSRL